MHAKSEADTNYILRACCRPGFEGECAEELVEGARRHDVAARAEVFAGRGLVALHVDDAVAWARYRRAFRFDELVFTRQAFVECAHLVGLAPRDRVQPVVEAAVARGLRFARVFVEHGDDEDDRKLSALCRQLSALIEQEARERGLVDERARQRLHVLFLDATQCIVGTSERGNASDWALGIPRLRVVGKAPSRSALKLAEAIDLFVTDDGSGGRLEGGMRAVDLGAAPGGWSWLLAQRGIHVTAVDNGPLAPAVIATEFVRHERADGFHYQPPRRVDWMFCDIVDKPSRVAALVAEWVAAGWCRRTIFNLKLPMKKRRAALLECTEIMVERLERAGIDATLRFKQLYHDREEVTGFLQNVDGVGSGSGSGRRRAARPQQDPRRHARPQR